MPRSYRTVSDMEIDEISLVDRPANPHAKVSIAKRAPQEEAVADADEFYSEDGSSVDLNNLDFGQVVYDGDGNAFQWVPEDYEQEAEQAEAEVREPELVGKSLADQVREDLSKALTDIERDDVIAKAASEISKAEQRAAAAERIAKAERDLRLTREYIAKAAEYNVPVDPRELGPVLMHAAEALPEADCAVLHKALSAAGQMLFEEAGYTGSADNDDPMARIEAELEGQLSKSDTQLSKHQAVADYFTNNPAAYDEYVAGLGR